MKRERNFVSFAAASGLQLLFTGCEPSLPLEGRKPDDHKSNAARRNNDSRNRIGIYFQDFHVNDREETVRVAGNKLEVDPSLMSLFQAIEQAKPKELFIAVGINPHPEIRTRIESLCRYCEENDIQYEISEEVYFILGGKFKGR